MTVNRVTQEPGGREKGQLEIEAEDTHNKFPVAEEALLFLLNFTDLLVSFLSVSLPQPSLLLTSTSVSENRDTLLKPIV